MIPDVKSICDLANGCVGLGVVIGSLSLSQIAAICSIVWTLWRVGETIYKSVKRWRARRR